MVECHEDYVGSIKATLLLSYALVSIPWSGWSEAGVRPVRCSYCDPITSTTFSPALKNMPKLMV